jgi:hypothetical protein
MGDVAIAAGWLLAVVLLWAGGAKLRARARTAEGFARLGVPAARRLAVAVPVVEIAVAVGLVLQPRMGGVAALILLVVLTAFVSLRLAQGAEVTCGCFGGAREEPLTGAVVVRNAALMVAAAAALLAPAGVPAAPALESVLLVGAAAAGVAVIVALTEVRAATGRLWDNRLPTGPEGLA